MLLDGNERKEGGRKVERCPTIDEDPHRGDIPSLNVGLLARTLSAASYVVERISGVVPSRCESLKKHEYTRLDVLTCPFVPQLSPCVPRSPNATANGAQIDGITRRSFTLESKIPDCCNSICTGLPVSKQTDACLREQEGTVNGFHLNAGFT